MGNNYGIVIVTYNPNLDELNKKVDKYTIDSNALVVIVNNGDKLNISEHPNLIIKNLGKNMGIAYAQNIGVNYLQEKGIDLAFLLDQDTKLGKKYFEQMLKKWHSLKIKDSKLAVLSPVAFDRKTKKLLSTKYLVNDNLKIEFLQSGDKYNTLPISSGILVDTNIFEEIGGNCSEYFIDWVDFQFDLDIIDAGYHIYTTSEIRINHQIGNASTRKLLWKTIHPSNHSAFRNYYFFRNGILFMNKNRLHKFVKKFVITALLKRFICIFYEENKINKIKAMIDGIKDARKIIMNEEY